MTAVIRTIPSLQLAPQVLAPVQANGDLGIENLKKITTVVVTFTVDLIEALKSKNYLDLLRIVPSLLLQGNIIAFAPLAWAEIQDTSKEESNEWHQHFTKVLDLPNDDTERLIERAFAFIPRVYATVQNILGLVADIKAFAAELSSDMNGTEAEVVNIARRANTTKMVSTEQAKAA